MALLILFSETHVYTRVIRPILILIFLKKIRLLEVVEAQISVKCINVDQETATFLSKSTKLQQFKKEQFEKHQVVIDLKLTDPRNIWIVCEKSKIDNAEQELTSLIEKNKITSRKFNPIDPMKVCFLKEHFWDKIKEKEKSCMAEGVVIQEVNADLEIKGTEAGKSDMIFFLLDLVLKVYCKVSMFNFLQLSHYRNLYNNTCSFCIFIGRELCVIKVHTHG